MNQATQGEETNNGNGINDESSEDPENDDNKMPLKVGNLQADHT